jgi:hypothetical protein
MIFYWTFPYCHEIVARGVGVSLILALLVFIVATIAANQ